jgi:hypothetical protein
MGQTSSVFINAGARAAHVGRGPGRPRRPTCAPWRSARRRHPTAPAGLAFRSPCRRSCWLRARAAPRRARTPPPMTRQEAPGRLPASSCCERNSFQAGGFLFVRRLQRCHHVAVALHHLLRVVAPRHAHLVQPAARGAVVLHRRPRSAAALAAGGRQPRSLGGEGVARRGRLRRLRALRLLLRLHGRLVVRPAARAPPCGCAAQAALCWAAAAWARAPPAPQPAPSAAACCSASFSSCAVASAS